MSLPAGESHAVFEYDPRFSTSGIEVSPLRMPLSTKTYAFPALSREAFHGLPGLLADSLPDKWGNALTNAWLARQGRAPESFDAVERLCYTGARGMGALEYTPVLGPSPAESEPVAVSGRTRCATSCAWARRRVALEPRR